MGLKDLANELKQKALVFAKASYGDIVIPNFFYKQFESDIFKLSASGYAFEYEIKVSRSDFKIDFLKSRFERRNGDLIRIMKHDEIEFGGRVNRFYFVTSHKLILPSDVPYYAGLIEANKYGRLEILKAAPLLSHLKPPDGLARELAQKLAFRDQVMRRKMDYLKMKNRAKY